MRIALCWSTPGLPGPGEETARAGNGSVGASGLLLVHASGWWESGLSGLSYRLRAS